MNLPTVSIIIPTFNRSQLLQQALLSVQQQTYPDWEVLVVDDGSEDNTEVAIIQLAKADPRIRYLKRTGEGRGAPRCRNLGMEASVGEYIIYLDADDCLAPQALENRLNQMENDRTIDYGVFPCILFQDRPGDMRLLWNVDKPEENDLDRFLALDMPWQTTSPIWRRSAIDKLGIWQENLPSWQDWEYHLRALIKNLKYRKFSEPDCFWRIAPKTKHGSIGKASNLPDNLKSHEQLFLQIETMLIDAGLFNHRRENLLLGLYSWLAKSWVVSGNKKEGLRIWQFCYEKNWMDDRLYRQGKWYLENIANIPVMRGWIRKYLEFSCQKGIWLYSAKVKTFRKIPLPESWQFNGAEILFSKSQ